MSSFAALRTTANLARARVMPVAARNMQRRNMGLGGSTGPPPEWEGIDKVVRNVFPQDYQLSAAILGGYFGLYVLYSISSALGGKKKAKTPEPEPVKAAPASSEGIPDVESADFVSFLESDALIKLLENEDALKAALK